MKTYPVVDSLEDDLTIGDKLFTVDPRLIELYHAFGENHVKRFCEEWGIEYIKVKLLKDKRRVYIFSD
jgi:tRNA(Ile)-lysidine synthase TilS/MesJ